MNEIKATRRRPKMRFTLRSLLVAFAIICIVLGAFVRIKLRADAQAQAVQAIVSHGGVVIYDFEYINGKLPIAYGSFALASRPQPSWAGRLFGVDFVHSVRHAKLFFREIPAELIEEFKRLPGLRELELSNGAYLKSAAWQELLQCSQIESLSIDFGFFLFVIKNQQLSGISNLRRLQALELKDGVVNSEEIKEISRIKGLKTLAFDGVSIKSDQSTDSLAALANLESFKWVSNPDGGENNLALHVPKRGAPDQAFKFLQELPNLQSIEITAHFKTTDQIIRYVSDLDRLTRLKISGSSLTGSELPKLSGLNNLTELDLSGTRLNDQTIGHLAGLATLKKLELGGTKISSHAMKTICQMDHLRELSIRGTPIDDEAVVHLVAMNKLRRLRVRGTKLTPEGIARLRDAMPNCMIEQ